MESKRALIAIDKLSDYLAGRSGSFYNHLFGAIFAADNNNLKKISEGYPYEVIAYKIYMKAGQVGGVE